MKRRRVLGAQEVCWRSWTLKKKQKKPLQDKTQIVFVVIYISLNSTCICVFITPQH